MTSVLPSNAGATGYSTILNSVNYDLSQIFADINGTGKTFDVNYKTISGVDLSELFMTYPNGYLTNIPFNSGYTTIINGINYDLSQIFVMYPIKNITENTPNIVIIPYNNIYGISFLDNSTFQFIENIQISGYVVGGGGGGAPGSTNSPGGNSGGGGGGGGTGYIINYLVTSNYSYSMVIGSAGIIVGGFGTSGGNSSFNSIATNTIGYGGTGGNGVGGLPGGNSISSDNTLGIGGSGGTGGTNGGGGGGGNGALIAGGGGGGGVGVLHNNFYTNYDSGGAGGNGIVSGSGGYGGDGGIYSGGIGGSYQTLYPYGNPGIYGAGGGGGATDNSSTGTHYHGGDGGKGYGLITIIYT